MTFTDAVGSGGKGGSEFSGGKLYPGQHFSGEGKGSVI